MQATKVSYWRIAGDLLVGGEISARGRSYTLTAIEDYTTKTGRASAVLTWRSTCTKCGKPFGFKTGRGRFEPKATCERHRPGQRG